MFFVDGGHDHGGQRRNADGHSKAENNYRGEERGPVRASDARPGKKNEPGGGDERARHQQQFGAIAFQETTRPAREEKHQQDERKKNGAGLRGGVTLNLDQVQWEKEQHGTERAVEKKSQQVGAAECWRAKQREG